MGQYQQAVDEAKDLLDDSSSDIATYSTIYYYRALAHINPNTVIKELNNNKSSTALLVVRLYAEYLNNKDNFNNIDNQLNELLSNDITNNDITLRIIAGLIYINEKNYKNVLTVLNNYNENLESLILQITIYILIHRVDIAKEKLTLLINTSDDDVLSILGQSYVTLYNGDKTSVQNVLYELNDLSEKFGHSVVTYNLIALCHTQLNDYTTAVQTLKQARQYSIQQYNKPNDVTLINTITNFNQLNKQDIAQRVYNELNNNYANHDYIQLQSELAEKFDRAASNYKVPA